MNDEIYAAIYFAGPSNWGHLIAPTRYDLGLEEIAVSLSSALNVNRYTRTPGKAITALTSLAVAAVLLSNKIAGDLFITTAQDVYAEALAVARKLDTHETPTHPWFQADGDVYRAAMRGIRSNDPRVHAMLLVDLIRIANRIAEG